MKSSYAMYTAPTKTSPELSIYQCGWQVCNKEHFYGPAVRDHFLIHYIIKGEGEYTTGGKTYQLKKGDGFLIPPSEVTFYKANEENPWEYYWVGFHGSEAKSILSQMGLNEKNLIFNYSADNKLEEYLKKMYFSSKQKQAPEYAMMGYLYLFFSCLIKVRVNNDTGTLNYETHLNKALKYIQGNYSNDISIREVANYVGIDRSHLFRIFKARLNISPQNYIINYRLTKAKALLSETNLNISQVAFSIGFNDPAHFSKLFTQYYKVSPKEYKNNPFDV